MSDKITIKIGVIADQTGALSIMGAGQANVATLVADEMNASGGLLGRDVELIIEDSATDDEQAAAAATKLVQDDHVDVLLGGIFSSTRQAIKQPAVVEGETLYIYPEQYEGQEYHPLLFCTGAVPAQQVEPLIPWVMQQTGARTFYLPSADYIWPHVMNRKVQSTRSGRRSSRSAWAARTGAGPHVQHILDKTGARTRTAATVWAFERHLVPSA